MGKLLMFYLRYFRDENNFSFEKRLPIAWNDMHIGIDRLFDGGVERPQATQPGFG
jgi:hypothetical protein